VICRSDLGNRSVLRPWIQAECVVETGAIGGTGPNHAKRSGIIKHPGDPLLLPDEMRYLYCIRAGRICFCPEIIDSFLMYRCLLSAEWHTASAVRQSGQHLYHAAPCAARGSSGVWTCRPLVHELALNDINCVKLFFEFVFMSCVQTESY
jgi:hypothetical protein